MRKHQESDGTVRPYTPEEEARADAQEGAALLAAARLAAIDRTKQEALSRINATALVAEYYDDIKHT